MFLPGEVDSKLLALSLNPGHLGLADVSTWKIPHNESTTPNYTPLGPFFSSILRVLRQV